MGVRIGGGRASLGKRVPTVTEKCQIRRWLGMRQGEPFPKCPAIRRGWVKEREAEGDWRHSKRDSFVRVREAKGRVVSVVPHRETLEDIFVRDALADRS